MQEKRLKSDDCQWSRLLRLGPGAFCFSLRTTVTTRAGKTTMDKLRVGDEVRNASTPQSTVPEGLIEQTFHS